VIVDVLTITVILVSYVVAIKAPFVRDVFGEIVYSTYIVSSFVVFVIMRDALFDEASYLTSSDDSKVNLALEFGQFMTRVGITDSTIVIFLCIVERKRLVYRVILRTVFGSGLILRAKIPKGTRIQHFVLLLINRVVIELVCVYIHAVLGRLFTKSENLQLLNTQMSYLMKQTPIGSAIFNFSGPQPKLEFVNSAICQQVQSWDPDDNLQRG
jgi:hypothetical protein